METKNRDIYKKIKIKTKQEEIFHPLLALSGHYHNGEGLSLMVAGTLRDPSVSPTPSLTPFHVRIIRKLKTGQELSLEPSTLTQNKVSPVGNLTVHTLKSGLMFHLDPCLQE